MLPHQKHKHRHSYSSSSTSSTSSSPHNGRPKKSYGRLASSPSTFQLHHFAKSDDDHDGKFKPKRVSSTVKINRQMKIIRKTKLAKYGIPALYLILLIIVLSSIRSPSNYPGSSWLPSIFSSNGLDNSQLPDAKNELLEENKEESTNQKQFPYTADVSVLPNAPFKHAAETTDIRSTVILYYHSISNYLKTLKSQPKFENLPVFQFNWKDWVDMKDLQPLIEEKPDCFIAGVLGSNVRTEWPGCVDANLSGNKEKDKDKLNFYFDHPASEHESQFRLNLRAKTYLYSVAPNPSSLVYLLKDLALISKVNENGKKDVIRSGMLEKFIKDKMQNDDMSYQQVINGPINIYSAAGEIENLLNDKIVKDEESIGSLSNAKTLQAQVDLPISKFEMTVDKKKSKLAAAAFQSGSQQYFQDVLIQDSNNNNFREAYDWRFFKKTIDDESTRHQLLHQLIRGWLQMTNNLGITTWLSQESLLGWNKNGLLSPWERTAHFDVPAEDMKRLASSFNQSLIIQDPRDGTGLFLIDVQPYYMERARENNGNASPDSIDLRFIDTRTGLYLEVNGLVKSKIGLSVNEQLVGSLSADADYLTQIGLTLGSDNVETVGSVGKILNSGSGQFYHLDQLSPLKKTLFEGRLANVPQRSSQILKGFYGYLPSLNQFNGFKFVDHLRLWVEESKCNYVPLEDVQLFQNGGSSFIGACHDEDVWWNYVRTQQSTLYRFKEKSAVSETGDDSGNVIELSNNDEIPSLYEDYYLNVRMEVLNKVYGVELPKLDEVDLNARSIQHVG
ncbi:unnamed protein product [Ambrosiozyma monospora]|uniref:Unnamed protein product n=1 Tax=Ambrosiozyma monospora TaxID=43982 RepID=A0A9W6YZ40_AMBMO|nr:unnamed protein product [Ambrosiozyma monospora]